MLKGFYGRYYNNLADGFSSANPGGTNYADYNFIDLNHNGTLRRSVRSWARCARASAALTRRWIPNARTPYTEEFSGSVEHQFWGESSVRVTYVRKHSGDFIPFYYNPYVPAWDGKLTVPTRQVSSDGQVFNLVDVPNSLASQSSALYTNIPGQRLLLRHDRGGVQQALQLEVLRPDERRLPVAQRAAVGRHSRLGLDQPAVDRSDRRQLLREPEPVRVEPSEDDDVSLPAAGAVHVPVRDRLRRELPVPERVPVLGNHRGRRHVDPA